jgi:hypothetical protein
VAATGENGLKSTCDDLPHLPMRIVLSLNSLPIPTLRTPPSESPPLAQSPPPMTVKTPPEREVSERQSADVGQDHDDRGMDAHDRVVVALDISLDRRR